MNVPLVKNVLAAQTTAANQFLYWRYRPPSQNIKGAKDFTLDNIGGHKPATLLEINSSRDVHNIMNLIQLPKKLMNCHKSYCQVEDPSECYCNQ